jgi:ribosomal protein L23
MADEKKQAGTKKGQGPGNKSKEAVAVKTVDPYGIIKYPLSTEKSIRQIEFDNKIVFAVHPQATKRDVKKAVEELFKVQVAKVNIQNSFTGIKKAYVKLGPASLASDVSADLGLI